MKQKLFSNTFFVNSFFSSLMSPFYIAYFQTLGITVSQISMMILCNSLAVMIFEIPTGVVADGYSRKWSVVISKIFSIVVSLGTFLCTDYIPLFLLFVLSGIGSTFNSGAISAWFIDNCKFQSKNDSDSIQASITKMSKYRLSGQFCGFIAGGILGFYGVFRFLWLIQAVGTLFLLIAYLAIPEAPFKSSSRHGRITIYAHTVKKGFATLFQNKLILFPMLLSMVFYVSSGMLSMVWQPFFQEQGVPMSLFGIILMLYTAFCYLSPWVIEKFFSDRKSELSIYGGIHLVCGFLTMMIALSSKFSPLFFILYGLVNTMESIVFDTYLNKRVESEIRATALSAYSLLISFSTIISSLWIACFPNVSLAGFLLVSASIVFITGTFSLLFPNPNKGKLVE